MSVINANNGNKNSLNCFDPVCEDILTKIIFHEIASPEHEINLSLRSLLTVNRSFNTACMRVFKEYVNCWNIATENLEPKHKRFVQQITSMNRIEHKISHVGKDSSLSENEGGVAIKNVHYFLNPYERISDFFGNSSSFVEKIQKTYNTNENVLFSAILKENPSFSNLPTEDQSNLPTKDQLASLQTLYIKDNHIKILSLEHLPRLEIIIIDNVSELTCIYGLEHLPWFKFLKINNAPKLISLSDLPASLLDVHVDDTLIKTLSLEHLLSSPQQIPRLRGLSKFPLYNFA